MSKELIGVGITTCNRPEMFLQCINSLDFSKFDFLVVVNDGAPFEYKLENGIFIQNEVNLGVAKSKNKIFKTLLDLGATHIFTLEDDCYIKNNDIFKKYIHASKVTGIPHFNYGPGAPWNRKQKPNLIGDLSKRHLAVQTTEPNPKLIIKYNKEVTLCLYQHIVAMFCYFNRSILEEVGLMNEEFYNAWEHVEHTYRIIKAGKYTPFWWFADISDSQDYIQEAEGEKGKTTLAKNEEEFKNIVMAGLKVFKKLHNTVPSNISAEVSKEEITAILKRLRKNK